MKYKKVLLINFPYKNSFFEQPKILAGLGYIAEALETRGIEYQVFDMNLGYDKDQLAARISEFAPDLLAVTLMTFRYGDSYELINELKRKFKGADIVVGGPHSSLFRETMLKDCPGIDYGIVLEGERTIVELCEGADPAAIPGLIFRSGDRIVFNGERDFAEDLDSIKAPRYSKFELDKYPYPDAPNAIKDIPLVSSRGCPFECIYCPVMSAIGRKFRYRSAAGVVSEIKYWYDRGFRTFWFADDNFTLLNDRVYEICDGIEASGMKGLALGCGNGIRADKVDLPLLKRMKEAGFNAIGFGVESGSDKVLKTLKKGETLEKIEAAIKNATDLGFSVSLSFLIGSPGETEQDVQKSFSLAKRYPIEGVRFYHIIPYPKTELYQWIEEKGYFVHEPPGYLNEITSVMNDPVFQTPELPVKLRKKLFLAGRDIEHNVYIRFYTNKFMELGFPRFLAAIFARIYKTKTLHDMVTRTGPGGKIKDWVKSRLGLKRPGPGAAGGN